MASKSILQRRSSKDILVLFQNLTGYSQLFISQYEKYEAGVRVTLQELIRNSDKIKDLHSETNKTRLVGTAVCGLGLGLGGATVGVLSYGHFEKTMKLLFGFTAMLTSTIVTYVGATTLHEAKLKMVEKGLNFIETWRNQSEEFKNMIEPQRNALKDLKNVLDVINKTAATDKTAAAAAQAETTLSEIDRFMQLFQQMDELAAYDRAKLIFTKLVIQYEKIYEELTKMRRDLRDIEQ